MCAENGLGGKVLEHVLERVVYADDELGDHRVDDAFARARRGARARPSRARAACMFLPWLSGSLAPHGSTVDPRRLREHVARDRTRATCVRAVVEGVAHNLGVAAPARRGVHRRARSTRSRSSAARARSAPWCQVLADVLDRPVVAARPTRDGAARAMALLALAAARRRSRATTSTDVAAVSDATLRARPAHHERYADRQVQFEAAYAALLPISEALQHE